MVNVGDRKQSKVEVVLLPAKINDMVIDLMQRNFGIRDLEELVRVRYAHKMDPSEDFIAARLTLHQYKIQLNEIAATLCNNVRMANSIYPTNMHEYQIRRDQQTIAIGNCEQLKDTFQRIINRFYAPKCGIDINVFGPATIAITREIDLIKDWRQSDNKMRSYLKG